MRHFITGQKKFSVNCTYNYNDHEGCVACHHASKDGFIKPATRRAGFSVIDTRKYRVTEKQEGDKTFKEWKLITNPKELREAKDLTLGGMKAWDVPPTLFGQITDFDLSCHKHCLNCNKRSIDILYECSNSECGEMIDYNPQEASSVICGECKENIRPKPVFECQNCNGDTKPAKITDAYITVTKLGVAPKFTYNLGIAEFGPLHAEHTELEEFDLVEYFKPDSAMDQAQSLGVKNPFGTKNTSYDEPKDKAADDGTVYDHTLSLPKKRKLSFLGK